MNNYRFYITITLLALGSWGISAFLQQTEVENFVATQGGEEYFSISYEKIEMGREGQPENILTADSMAHFTGSGITHLENPYMVMHGKNVHPWKITSESAELSADGEKLFLKGKVNIQRKGSKKSRPIVVNTSDLDVMLPKHFAQTSQWAEVISQANRTQGVGMKVTFKEPVYLQFLNKVKGRYNH